MAVNISDKDLAQLAQPSMDEERAGDLGQIISGLEALRHRVGSLNAKLAYLYGDVENVAQARPVGGGKIGRIQALIDDLGDAVSQFEGTVERL